MEPASAAPSSRSHYLEAIRASLTTGFQSGRELPFVDRAGRRASAKEVDAVVAAEDDRFAGRDCDRVSVRCVGRTPAGERAVRSELGVASLRAADRIEAAAGV